MTIALIGLLVLAVAVFAYVLEPVLRARADEPDVPAGHEAGVTSDDVEIERLDVVRSDEADYGNLVAAGSASSDRPPDSDGV